MPLIIDRQREEPEAGVGDDHAANGYQQPARKDQ